ncbi:MAG: hypothetical protein Rhob2KO_54350 [Rhodopirellula baltica]
MHPFLDTLDIPTQHIHPILYALDITAQSIHPFADIVMTIIGVRHMFRHEIHQLINFASYPMHLVSDSFLQIMNFLLSNPFGIIPIVEPILINDFESVVKSFSDSAEMTTNILAKPSHIRKSLMDSSFHLSLSILHGLDVMFHVDSPLLHMFYQRRHLYTIINMHHILYMLHVLDVVDNKLLCRRNFVLFDAGVFCVWC